MMSFAYLLFSKRIYTLISHVCPVQYPELVKTLFFLATFSARVLPRRQLCAVQSAVL